MGVFVCIYVQASRLTGIQPLEFFSDKFFYFLVLKMGKKHSLAGFYRVFERHGEETYGKYQETVTDFAIRGRRWADNGLAESQKVTFYGNPALKLWFCLGKTLQKVECQYMADNKAVTV